MTRKGETTINGKDAFTTYGAWLDDTALSALMTPAPKKDYIANKSPLSHGKKVLPAVPMDDERDITLTLCIKGDSLSDFLAHYQALCELFQNGAIDIATAYQPGVVYHFIYVSCQQFSQFNGRLGKFILKLNEPNPRNRS